MVGGLDKEVETPEFLSLSRARPDPFVTPRDFSSWGRVYEIFIKMIINYVVNVLGGKEIK